MSVHDAVVRVTSTKVGRAGLACTAGLGAVLVPGFAFAEGETTTTDAVQTAITGMAGSVADGALAMIAAILPVLAPIVAAIIVATLGYRLVKRFSK